MPRAGASKFRAHDIWREENADQLRAACKEHKVRYPDAVNLVGVLTRKAKPDGTTDQTYAQLVEATGLNEAQIRRALTMLTKLGVLVTVRPARSGGRNGGKGRAPIRRLSFLTVSPTVEAAADQTATSGSVDNPKWLRTKSEMAAHSGAHPYGSSSTETPLRGANAERAAGERGGNDAQKHQGKPTGWRGQVLDAVAEQLYEHDAARGLTSRVRSPKAVKRGKAGQAAPHLADLENQGYALDQIKPGSETWYDLVTVLACRVTGESPSDQAWENLFPYRRQLATTSTT